MATRVGINGFGRIGRNFFRAQHALGSEIEIVALNDLGDAKTMAHLLRYDSVLGPFSGNVELGDGTISAAGETMKMLSEPSACCARKKLRPIRPKPLMPTRVAMRLVPPWSGV